MVQLLIELVRKRQCLRHSAHVLSLLAVAFPPLITEKKKILTREKHT